MRSTSSCGIATILASADEKEPPMPDRPQHLLALDQGTSSSRAIVFDARGQIVALAQREFRQIFPQPGWVEHDPKEIWSSQLATGREALAKAGLDAADIVARRRSSGTARPASRSPTRSSGRTAAPRRRARR
jgi:hypothetical protein